MDFVPELHMGNPMVSNLCHSTQGQEIITSQYHPGILVDCKEVFCLNFLPSFEILSTSSFSKYHGDSHSQYRAPMSLVCETMKQGNVQNKYQALYEFLKNKVKIVQLSDPVWCSSNSLISFTPQQPQDSDLCNVPCEVVKVISC